MTLVFHKRPILLSAKTLQSLLDKYSTYSDEIKPSRTDEERYEEYLSAANLLSGSIETIKMSRNALQALIDKLQKEYEEARSKGNKKDLTNEVEEIENDTQFNERIAKANEMVYILSARVTEARNHMGKLARKMGITHREPTKQKPARINETHADQQTATESTATEETEEGSSQNDAIWLSEDNSNSEKSREDDEDFICRTLKPRQLSLPRFYGDEEEFPEFWAIYETLVDQSKVLSTVEKMLLLRDSLKGRAETAIKGIQLIPQNYKWMINALKKKYGNKPTNRAKIVQKLINLPAAKNDADSCMNTFDKIRMLMNQMVSAGQNIPQMQDAMWTEKILEKFPYTIVKNVLVTIQDQDEVKIEDVMDHLEKEINAKKFVDARLKGRVKFENHPNRRQYGVDVTEPPKLGKICRFCDNSNHISANCRTITDIKSRRNMVKEARQCWKCFSEEHSSYDCQKPNCPKCGKMHDVSLCISTSNDGNRTRYSAGDRSRNQSSSNTVPVPRNNTTTRNQYGNGRNNGNVRNNQQTNPHTADHSTNHSAEGSVYIDKRKEQVVLMTAEGNVWNNNTRQFEKLLFFFDTGAQKTIIREQTAREFGLPTQKTEICTMSGIGGHTEKYQTNIVPLKISNAFGKEIHMTIQTKPIITNGFSSVRLNDADKQYLQDNEICINNPRVRGEHQNPQILVGLDNYYDLVNTVDTITLPSGLRIARTVFGPTVHGKGSINSQQEATTITHGLSLVQEQNESEILQKLFELDGLGISSEECTKNENTFEYFKSYSKSISFENGVVTVPFPLKDNVIDLTDNYGIAYRRLISLQRQLSNNIHQREWYNKIMNDYIQNGVVELVHGQNKNSAGTYYMPHSGVWKPEKAKPLRIVFDASSKRVGQLSLNDVIYTGESFVNKIHDVLVASRTSGIILLCDIEAAFTQIRLVEDHKDLCRFLWLKDMNKPPNRDNIAEYRFNRLPFGNTSAPSILNMAILAYLNHKNTPLSLEIAKNIYVDNILLCATTKEEALEKYTASKNIFREIGMNLREYISNSAEVNRAIPKEDRAPTDNIKLLGVKYDTKSDEFVMKVTIPQKEKLTKRDIVSQINSIYDPVGLASPLIIKLKSLMREIYDTGIEWKQYVPQALCIKWNSVIQEINNACIRVSRPLLRSPTSHTSRISLWVFCDASKMAISTCAYLRCENTNEITSLISGKSKLTPKKIQQTIPRLELLAILIGLRMAKTILDSINIEIISVNVASDSEIALQWIRSSRKLPIFVTNQKDRILRLKTQIEVKSIPVHLFHVPTHHNPADVGTRGTTASLISDHDWVRGPRWLEHDQQTWLIRSIDNLSCDQFYEEIEDNQHVNVETTNESAESSRLIIDLARFSRYKTALRTFSVVGKLLSKWVKRCNYTRSTSITLNVLSLYTNEDVIAAEDMEISEKLILAAIHENINVQKLQKRFPNQKIIRDEKGIIRYKSRIQNANLPYDAKMPIFIPNYSELARLIIHDLHYGNAHCGKEQTLTLARQRFWIPQPSRMIKKYLRTCNTCKKCHGLPYGAQEMPQTDYQQIGAVHLEVVENLSAGAFLSSFIRFISRRGVPKLIRTDCGTNFKLGSKVIENLFLENDENGSSVMSYSASEGIKWIFNPPASPWMGGAWERMVGSVKRCFQKSIGRKKLSFEQMTTVISRIEAIINTRPLTKVSATDLDEIPIRPIDFLQGNLKYSIPSTQLQCGNGDTVYDPELLQTVAQAQEALMFSETIATVFWERWNKEYLTSLRDNQRVLLKQPRHVTNTPQIGEIVLIEQEFLPRGNWMYGKVLETVPSADGLVRSAKLLTPNKRVIQRPLNKLYPLEIRSSVGDSHLELEKDSTSEREIHQKERVDSAESSSRRTRPTRQSKTHALKVIQEFERSLDRPSTSSSRQVSTYLLMAMLALSTICPVTATAHENNSIKCNEGRVEIVPPSSRFELCINAMCRIMSNVSKSYIFELEKSSLDENSTITLRSECESSVVFSTMQCEPPDFCEKSALLMSKDLIGNPHCWPLGAIITLTVLVYLSINSIMLIIWLIKCTRNAKRKGTPNSTSEEETIPMRTFNPHPINIPSALLICVALLALASKVITCQHGYMRHSVEVVCENRGNCTYNYNEEVLFNRINSNLCIQLNHANKTIGLIKIRSRPMKLSCSKVSLFFTRETKLKIYHTTRCSQMGSCTQSKCSRIRLDEVIPEFKRSSPYPGYSICGSTCGGIACGCFLPFPACTFLRIAHVPKKTQTVFEVVSCMEWQPVIQIDVDFMLYNKGKLKSFSLQPYVTQKYDELSLTVISLQKPHSPLMDKRFAVTPMKAMMLPDHYQLPVECESEASVLDAFVNCTNRMICSCENMKAPQTIFSSLYELTPVGQWTELQYRLSESYVDMLAFAVVGPITQILVVEGRKNYVLQFSVRESEVVDRRRLAVCERPGAMARDEAGRLFVANRSSASIQLVDTVRWTSARNVALADSLVPHFSASWGLLAIPLKGAIRLQRYSFRFGCK
ncbi:hypothetical protein RB195_002489 [Necator americanus]|uniref:Integrase catalytic domain-containing protein n=2 Tax=Necator americanus TaxID=51031 RepID=A0ABR1DJA4_NECAM